MEPLSDFDFYLKFAKPLILNLPQINDRTLAAAWVRKLVDEQSDEIKLDYIKLLLFVLQRQKLVQPFDKHPNESETLEAFPEGHDLVKVAQAILEKDRAEKLKKKKECQSGDYPPYFCDFSANLLEYAAVQNIENFGIHGYYAISKIPLPQWYRVDTKVLPKAAKSMIEVSPQPPTVTGTLSSPQLRDASPEKPKSPQEVSFGPSPPVEKPPAEEAIPEDLDETVQPPSPPPKPETPEPFTMPKKRPKPPQSPARLLGKPPEKDDREPPSWGSNLLEIKGFVQDEYNKDDLDLIWTSAASLPYQTPPRPGAAPVSELWTSPASLPYKTPPRPPSPPFAASSQSMDFDDDDGMWASGIGYDDGDFAFDETPPSFLETSGAGEDATPIKPEAYSLPYATPRIPGVTPPPPGKPTPPPKRALRAPTKSKVAGAVQLEVESKPGPSKLPPRRLVPPKKGKKAAVAAAAAAKAPTPPAYDLDELAKLGLTEDDLQDINLDDIDIDLADISDPSDYEAAEDSLDKQMNEFSKMITELEAASVGDVAQLGVVPAAVATVASPARSPAAAAAQRSRSPSPALARAKATTSPIPAAHDAPVRLDQSIHMSPEAKRILGESAHAAVQLQVVQAPAKRRSLVAPKVSARAKSPQPSTSAAAIAEEQAEMAAAAPRRSRLVAPGGAKRAPKATSPKPSTLAAATAAEGALSSGIGASKAGSALIPPKTKMLKRPAAKKPSQEKKPRESEYDLKELEDLGLTEEDLVDINLDDIDLDLVDVDLSDDEEVPPSDEEGKTDIDKSLDNQIDEYSKMIEELEAEYAQDVVNFGDMVLSPTSLAAHQAAAAKKSPTSQPSSPSPRQSKSPTAALLRAKGQTSPIPKEHDAGVELDQHIHVSPAAREILNESVKAKTPSPQQAPPRRQLARRTGLPQRRTREEIYKDLVSEAAEAEEPQPVKAKKSKSKLGSLVKTFNKMGETSMRMGEAAVSDERDAEDMAEIQSKKDLAKAGVEPLGPIQQLQVGDDDGAVAGPSSAATPRQIPQRGLKAPNVRRLVPPKTPRTKALERRAQVEAAPVNPFEDISERMPSGASRSPPKFGDQEWVPATDFFKQDMKYSPKSKSPRGRRTSFPEGTSPPVLSPSSSVEQELIDLDEELGIISEDLITSAMSPSQDVKEYMDIIAFTEHFTKESPAMSGVPVTTPKHSPSPKRLVNASALLDFSPPEFADSPEKSPRAASPQGKASPFLTPGRSTSPGGGYTPSPRRSPSPRPSPFLSPGGYTPPLTTPKRSPSPQRPSPFLSPGGYTPKPRSPGPPTPPAFDPSAVPFEDMFIYGDEIGDTSPVDIDEDELPDDKDPRDAFTWEYDSPGIEYAEQKPVEHTFAGQEAAISPQRVFWRDRADEIKTNLFGTPEQRTPTVFDLPADRVLGETPPEFAPAEYVESPPIDAEALKAELREAEMVPYRRPRGARIQMPKRKEGTTTLSGIQEQVEGLDEDEYNRIMKAKGIKHRRPMNLKVGKKTRELERHSQAPKLGMIEEFHDIEYPSVEGEEAGEYTDIFSVPFQGVDASLMGIDLPEELVPQQLSPLISPEIDRKELYKDILRQKKAPYKFPYRERVSGKYYVDRRSLPPQQMDIAEFPEYMSEEDQQFVEDVESAPYVYGSRQMVEGQRVPRLQPVQEVVEYPDTPKGRASPMPKVRARRKKVPRERLKTRKLDFDAPDEYAQDAAAAAGYPNAVLLEAMSAVEAEQKAKTPARPRPASGLRAPGASGLQAPGTQRPSTLGLQRPSGLQRPGASGLQRPGPSGLQRPGPSGLQRPGPSGLQRPGPSGLQRPGPSGLQRPSASSEPRKIAVKKKLDKKCVDYAAAGSSNEQRVQAENLEVYIDDDSPELPPLYGSSGRRRIFHDAFANIPLVSTPAVDGTPRTPPLRIIDEESMPEGYYSPEFTPPTPFSRPEALQSFAQEVKAHEMVKKGRPHREYKQWFEKRQYQPRLGGTDEVPIEERAAEIHDELEEQLEEEDRQRQSLLDTSVPGGLKSPLRPETEATYKTPPHLKRREMRKWPTPTNPEERLQPTAERDILTFTDFEFPEDPASPEFGEIIASAQDDEGNLFDDEDTPDLYDSPVLERKFEDIQQNYGEGEYGLDSEGIDLFVSPTGSPAAAQLVVSKSPSPRAPSPRVPSPRAPSPRAPSPRAPSPRAPSPRAPSPRAPSPRAPSPRAPSPRAPSPRAPSPRAPSPRAPSPRAPSPRAPSPRAPSPRAPSPKKAEYDVKELEELGLTEADLVDINLDDLNIDLDIDLPDDVETSPSDEEGKTDIDKSLDDQIDEYSKMIAEAEADYAQDLAKFVSPRAPSPKTPLAQRAPSPRAPSPRPSTSTAPSPRRASPKTPATSLTVEAPQAPARRPVRRLMAPGTMAKGRGLKAPAAPRRLVAPAPVAKPKGPSPVRPPTPPTAADFDIGELKDEEIDLFEDDDIEFEYKERVIDANGPQVQVQGQTELDLDSMEQLGLHSELVHGIRQAEERMVQEMEESPDHSAQMYETLNQTTSKMQRQPIYLKSKAAVERGLRHRHSRLGRVAEGREDVVSYADDWFSLKNQSPGTRATYFAPDVVVSPTDEQAAEEEQEWEYNAPPSPSDLYTPIKQRPTAQDTSMFSPPQTAKSPYSSGYKADFNYQGEDFLFDDNNKDADVLNRPPTPKTPEIFERPDQLYFSPPTPPEEYVDVFENLPEISIDVFGEDTPEGIYPSPIAPGVTSPTYLASDLSEHERYMPQYGPRPSGYISPRVPVRRSQAPSLGQLPEYLEPKPQPRTPSPRAMKKMVKGHDMTRYKKKKQEKFEPKLPQHVEEVMTPPNIQQQFGYNDFEESPPEYFFSPPTPEEDVGDDLELCSPPFGAESPVVSPVPSPEAKSWWQQKVASPPMRAQPIHLAAAPLHEAIADVPYAATLDEYDYGDSPPSPFLQPQTPPPRTPPASPFLQGWTPSPRRAASPAPSPRRQASPAPAYVQTPSPRRVAGPSPAPSPYYEAQTPPPRRAASRSPVSRPKLPSPSNLAEFKKAVEGLKILLDDFKTDGSPEKTKSPMRFSPGGVGSPPQYISPNAASPNVDDIIDVNSATCLDVERTTPEGFARQFGDDTSPIPELDYSDDEQMDFKWLD